ncbi:unnamed protein product, partial [Nesidiocoris tenuis]
LPKSSLEVAIDADRIAVRYAGVCCPKTSSGKPCRSQVEARITRQAVSIPRTVCTDRFAGVEKKEDELATLYDVLFDDEMICGVRIYTETLRCYRLTKQAFINLTFGLKKQLGLVTSCTLHFQNINRASRLAKEGNEPGNQLRPEVPQTQNAQNSQQSLDAVFQNMWSQLQQTNALKKALQMSLKISDTPSEAKVPNQPQAAKRPCGHTQATCGAELASMCNRLGIVYPTATYSTDPATGEVCAVLTFADGVEIVSSRWADKAKASESVACAAVTHYPEMMALRLARQSSKGLAVKGGPPGVPVTVRGAPFPQGIPPMRGGGMFPGAHPVGRGVVVQEMMRMPPQMANRPPYVLPNPPQNLLPTPPRQWCQPDSAIQAQDESVRAFASAGGCHHADSQTGRAGPVTERCRQQADTSIATKSTCSASFDDCSPANWRPAVANKSSRKDRSEIFTAAFLNAYYQWESKLLTFFGVNVILFLITRESRYPTERRCTTRLCPFIVGKFEISITSCAELFY